MPEIAPTTRVRWGVVHLQAGHQFREHVQLSSHLLHGLQLFSQRAGCPSLTGVCFQGVQLLSKGRQGLITGQKCPGGRADPAVRFLQAGGHRVDSSRVDVPVVTDGQQVTAQGCNGPKASTNS
ncbi:hypothetical protein ACFSC4_02000 [Deinococcus malanensis]|uniref:hypothetical protein n=1 Tax=Deinococcus malanensis TaxID=1706855 RepID=UPI0036297AEC